MSLILQINPEYKKLLPGHQKDDMNALRESIKEYKGIFYPLIVNSKGWILDGMTRWQICQEENINIDGNYTVRNFDEPLEEKLFVIECNLKRRNLNTYQKMELYVVLMDIEEELARKRHGVKRLSPDGDNSRSSEIVAKKTGMSARTLQRGKFVMENADEKMKEKLRAGEVSVAYAEKSLRTTEQANTPTPDMPEGEFELIYIDLPWDYDLKLTGAPPYKTLTLEEMKAEIHPPTYKDCIMFMWATNPKLLDAIAMLEHWGFQYKTNIAWVKMKNNNLQTGTGYYVKGSHELLLIATKGSPGVPPDAVRIPSVVFAERTRKHSEKPKIFYQIIEKYYPAKTKIEMFAREKRDGWTSWGDGVVG